MPGLRYKIDSPEEKDHLSPAKHWKEMHLRLPVLTITLILFCFLYSTSDWIGFRNPNEFSRLYLTKALIDRQTFVIDENIFARDTQDKSFCRGHYYSNKAPGSSFIAAPPYLAIRLLQTYAGFSPGENTVLYILRLVCVSIPSAIFLFLLFSFWGRITPSYSIRRALIIAYALGTPVWAYSSLFFGHQLVGICLFVAFVLIFEYRTSARRNCLLLQGGFFCGLACFIEYPAILVSFIFFLYACACRKKSGRRIWLFLRGKAEVLFLFFAGMALPLGAMCYYHWRCFGSVLRTPYLFVTDPVCAVGHSRGLSGVTFPLTANDLLHQISVFLQLAFSPFRGLFFFSPFLIIGIAGIFIMIRNQKWRQEGWLFGALVAAYFLFNSAFAFWAGGWSMGPRHLVPIIPFIVTAIVYLLSRVGLVARKKTALIMVPLVVVSITFTFFGTMVFPHLPIIFKNPLYELSYRFLSRGIFGPTVGRWLGWRGLLEEVPLLLVTGILLTIMLFDLSRLYSFRQAPRLGFTFSCLAISGALICLDLVLSSLNESRLPPGAIARQDASRELIGNFLGVKANRNGDLSVLRKE